MTETAKVERVVPGDPLHAALLAALAAEPLAHQWWEDAESRVDSDTESTSYMVVYVPGSGGSVPAAWAGWRIDTDGRGGRVLRCCDNYVRRGYRDQDPELYELAYRARHQVVRALGLPGETWLFPEPITHHLADGWTLDTTPGGSGTSRAHPDGPIHHWQRLTWTPERAPTPPPRKDHDMMKRIVDFQRYDPAGWQWTEVIDDDDLTITTRLRTDARGEGLWQWSDTDQCWRQGRGHLQWQMPQDEAAAKKFLAFRRSAIIVE